VNAGSPLTQAPACSSICIQSPSGARPRRTSFSIVSMPSGYAPSGQPTGRKRPTTLRTETARLSSQWPSIRPWRACSEIGPVTTKLRKMAIRKGQFRLWIESVAAGRKDASATDCWSLHLNESATQQASIRAARQIFATEPFLRPLPCGVGIHPASAGALVIAIAT
jgi:hypothetical protein